jgi:transcriptional regulator with XRE-family HTH domain
MTELSFDAKSLAAFVRAARERLTPEACGLPARHRRRAPGLRREEAANLCHISPTWLTYIEQGRTTGISSATLGGIARGLRLSRAERSYLFALAANTKSAPPPPEVSDPHLIEPLVQSVMSPAYVLDRHWDAVAWNAAAQDLFSGWLGGEERNQLRYVFLDASARTFIAEWHKRAARLVAEFRADTAVSQEDPVRRALVDELCHASPDFASAWASHSVLEREGGLRQFHGKTGTCQFVQYTLRPAAYGDLKLIVLTPAP